MNKFTVQLPNKKIECKHYTLREHLAILLAQTNYDSELLKKAFNNILEKCATTDLLRHEALLVLIHLMYKSNNQYFVEKDYICECGEQFPVKLDIDKAYIKDLNDEDLKIKFEKFTLNLKWPVLWEDDNTPLMIANSIQSINVGSEQLLLDELNENELTHLNNCIDESMMKTITDILLKPKPFLALPIKCPKCGKQHIEQIEGFKQFLELL